MKITKRQLRYLINESLNEEDDSDLGRRALSHVAAAGKALPPVAFAAALHDLAIYLTNPETDLEADVEEIWDKIDPRIQDALMEMGSAAKALPGGLKEKAIESIVSLLEEITKTIKLDEIIDRVTIK